MGWVPFDAIVAFSVRRVAPSSITQSVFLTENGLRISVQPIRPDFLAMTNSQRLAAVRRCLDRWLEKQQSDAQSDGDTEISDAMLIRGGFYVGRKFQLGPYHAVWFMEEDEIKIHDTAGAVVAKLDSASIDLASHQVSSLDLRIRDDESENIRVSTIPMQRQIPEATSENTAVRRAA